MIYEATERPDGFYEMGDFNDDSLNIWGVYYDDSVSEIVERYQILWDPVNYTEGPLSPGWIGIYSDQSRQELITELIDNRGKTLI